MNYGWTTLESFTLHLANAFIHDDLQIQTIEVIKPTK